MNAGDVVRRNDAAAFEIFDSQGIGVAVVARVYWNNMVELFGMTKRWPMEELVVLCRPDGSGECGAKCCFPAPAVAKCCVCDWRVELRTAEEAEVALTRHMDLEHKGRSAGGTIRESKDEYCPPEAPVAKYRPWTAAEAVGKVVCKRGRKVGEDVDCLMIIRCNGILNYYLGAGGFPIVWDELSRGYEQEDGTPCGVEVCDDFEFAEKEGKCEAGASPEAKYRPWTAEEAVGKVIERPMRGLTCMITATLQGINPHPPPPPLEYVLSAVPGHWESDKAWSWDDLTTEFRCLDGTPCGVEVQG